MIFHLSCINILYTNVIFHQFFRCNFEQAIVLASFSLQAESGDHDSERYGADLTNFFGYFSILWDFTNCFIFFKDIHWITCKIYPCCPKQWIPSCPKNDLVNIDNMHIKYLFQQISKFLEDSMDIFYGIRTPKYFFFTIINMSSLA